MAAGLTLGLTAGVGAGAETARPYRWQKTIDSPPREAEQILAVMFDDDVYEATRADLGDIRVLGSDARAVPFIIERAGRPRTRRVRRPCPVRIIDFAEGSDNVIEVVVELSSPSAPPPDEAVIETPLRDFEKRVSVLGAGPAAAWHGLAVDQPVFDYSRFIDVRNTTVRFPARPFARYKIVIENVTDVQRSPFLEFASELRGSDPVVQVGRTFIQRRDFRIDALTFWHHAEEQTAGHQAMVDYDTAGFEVELDSNRQCTQILVQTMRQPLTELHLQTTSRNFSRRATVQVRDERPGHSGWRSLGSDQITRLVFRDFEQTDLAVTFPERRARQFRLLVHDGDGAPLVITGVAARGRAHRVRFIAYPGVSYRLCYGAARVGVPDYDAAAVISGLGERAVTRYASLGAEVANPDYGNGWPGLAGLLGVRGVLAGALVLMVGVLAVAIVVALRRIGNLPDP